METLYVNLFAGPGTGKSTTSFGLMHKLKSQGINSELIQEYAKEKVWGEDFKTLSFQPYICAKQLFRQYRVMNQVDVAVTDTSLLFSLIYTSFGCTDSFKATVVEQFNLFSNLNFFIARNLDDHKYNPSGRMQTLEEAIVKDNQIYTMLQEYNIPFHVTTFQKDGSHVEEIFEIILSTIKR